MITINGTTGISLVQDSTITPVKLSVPLIGRNLIVNGSCQIDQVNSGALITPSTNDYPIDNINYGASQASKFQTQQITTSLSSLDATHVLRTTVLSQFTSAASDFFNHQIKIEGLNFDHLQWGTANASPISLQFKARSSVSGTFSGGFINYNATRSYVFSYTLVANTDTLVKIENISGDTSGTWLGQGVNIGFRLIFDIGTGTTYQKAAGSWGTGNYFSATSSISLVSQVNGSTFDISDIQLEKGSYCTTFERKLYDQVLRECQRYACSTFPQGTAWGQNAGAPGSLVVGSTASAYGTQLHWRFPVPMRATPTITTYNPSAANANARNQAATADRTYSINPFSNTSTSSFTGVADATGDVTGQSIAIHFSASSRL